MTDTDSCICGVTRSRIEPKLDGKKIKSRVEQDLGPLLFKGIDVPLGSL